MTIEIEVCNPRLIITLGEIPARVLSNDWTTKNKELLNGSISTKKFGSNEYKMAQAHPEIRRINKDWDKYTRNVLPLLAKEIERIVRE
jgi:uracil-DNA glycosylase